MASSLTMILGKQVDPEKDIPKAIEAIYFWMDLVSEIDYNTLHCSLICF